MGDSLICTFLETCWQSIWKCYAVRILALRLFCLIYLLPRLATALGLGGDFLRGSQAVRAAFLERGWLRRDKSGGISMTSQLGETREEMASSLIVLFLLKYPSLPKERSLPRATAHCEMATEHPCVCGCVWHSDGSSAWGHSSDSIQGDLNVHFKGKFQMELSAQRFGAYFIHHGLPVLLLSVHACLRCDRTDKQSAEGSSLISCINFRCFLEPALPPPLSLCGLFGFPAPECPLHPLHFVYIAIVELHGHFLWLSQSPFCLCVNFARYFSYSWTMSASLSVPV